MKPALRVISTGICVPERIVTNDEIRRERNAAIDPQWVENTLGIRQRRIAEDGVQTSDLAAKAAREALRNAGVAADSIDLVIVATSSPDQRAPATACFVQKKAGLTNAIAFDVSAVCSGFLFSLTTAASMLHAGQARRALVIGADIYSRVTDWGRRDCVFFGDGSGAALLETGPQTAHGHFDAELFTDSTAAQAFSIKGQGDSFDMNGPAVFNAAKHAVPRCINQVLARNGMTSSDVDIVVPHQPSRSLLGEIARRSDIPFDRFHLNMDRYANTVGATIPIALHEAVMAGKVHAGDRMLFAAAGAGFTAGAAIHHWC